MVSTTKKNFLKQQGFEDESDEACDMHFSGLYFQPWIVASLIAVGIVLQSPKLFYVLSLVLWWNAMFPRLNPFELFYNLVIARLFKRARLSAAPAPRRFAQGMSAAFMVLATIGIMSQWTAMIWFSQSFLVIAFAALLFGRFCLGAYIYHLLRGKLSFANSTLPWAKRS